MIQTILGSGGVIGNELAQALTAYTTNIRLVSRNPKKVNESDQLVQADLLKKEEVFRAVEGSEIVYVTVGFPYSYKIWKENWPVFITHAIEACKVHKAKLVFFDNVYMYDKNYLDGMTEETPIHPPSKKGRVRAQIADMIMQEVSRGQLQALIARSADFYGPGIANSSMLNETVVKPLIAGKKANWVGGANFKHSFTYTPDAGKATALLGNSADAYGQVWHLPTAKDPLTGKEWIEAVAKILDTKPAFQLAPKWMVLIIGLFVPIMKEMVEMTYQYDRDYVFDSSKFETHFKVKPTTYKTGLEATLADARKTG